MNCTLVPTDPRNIGAVCREIFQFPNKKFASIIFLFYLIDFEAHDDPQLHNPSMILTLSTTIHKNLRNLYLGRFLTIVMLPPSKIFALAHPTILSAGSGSVSASLASSCFLVNVALASVTFLCWNLFLRIFFLASNNLPIKSKIKNQHRRKKNFGIEHLF